MCILFFLKASLRKFFILVVRLLELKLQDFMDRFSDMMQSGDSVVEEGWITSVSVCVFSPEHHAYNVKKTKKKKE